MKKKKYNKPIIKIIEINNDQIIVTSGPEPSSNSFNDEYQDQQGYKI